MALKGRAMIVKGRVSIGEVIRKGRKKRSDVRSW